MTKKKEQRPCSSEYAQKLTVVSADLNSARTVKIFYNFPDFRTESTYYRDNPPPQLRLVFANAQTRRNIRVIEGTSCRTSCQPAGWVSASLYGMRP